MPSLYSTPQAEWWCSELDKNKPLHCMLQRASQLMPTKGSDRNYPQTLLTIWGRRSEGKR